MNRLALGLSVLLMILVPAACPLAQDLDMKFPLCAPLAPRFCADAAYFLVDSSYVVEVYFSVCNEGLQFVKTERGYRASADISAVLLGDDDDQVAGDTYRVRLSSPDYAGTNSADSCASHVLAFNAGPGEFKMVLGLYDRDSRERSVAEAKIKIEPLVTFPSLSDLVLQTGERGSGQGRGGLATNVRRVYSADQDSIWFYYEVYHGAAAESLGVVHRLVRRDGAEITETAVASVGRGRVVHHERLAADSLPNGRYILTVDVKNPAGEVTASRSKELEIRHSTFRLSGDVNRAVAMLAYLASASEIDRFEKADQEERKRLWDEFWLQRDPTPGTPRNEFLEEHEQRFTYACEHFAVPLTEGWQTDRGRIYIIYGQPDQVDSYPFEAGRKATEVWYYFRGGRRYVFVDETGFGDYVLVGGGG
jgi:GWxTD domain-containing protein